MARTYQHSICIRSHLRSMMLGMVVLMFLGLTYVMPSDVLAANCGDLEQNNVTLTANGAEGTLEVLFDKKPKSNSFNGTLTILGEPTDSVKGTCVGRHLVFTRVRNGTFQQTYDGWMISTPMTQKDGDVAGSFSHKKLPKSKFDLGRSSEKFPWCGQFMRKTD